MGERVRERERDKERQRDKEREFISAYFCTCPE